VAAVSGEGGAAFELHCFPAGLPFDPKHGGLLNWSSSETKGAGGGGSFSWRSARDRENMLIYTLLLKVFRGRRTLRGDWGVGVSV